MPIIRRSNCVPLPTVVCPVVSCCDAGELGGKMMMMMIIIIIVIFINCNWVVTRWQWLFYMYTNMKKKVTRKFKSGGLHERHVVATWKLGNQLSIRL